MPGKNKPKRLDRNRSWRVARRKKRKRDLVSGKGRNRPSRPKKNKTEKPAKTKPVKEKSIKKE